MTPERQNSSLLDNGSLTHVSMDEISRGISQASLDISVSL
jgi:hypothetical protein